MDRQSIENALFQLERLIECDTASEGDFQKWFEHNPVVFDLLGYQKVLPHPRLTDDGAELYVPDFLAQRVDGLWEIVEIKRSDTKVLKDVARRSAFYSAMETYISQCREYAQYFNDKAHRDEFHARYRELIQ